MTTEYTNNIVNLIQKCKDNKGKVQKSKDGKFYAIIKNNFLILKHINTIVLILDIEKQIFWYNGYSDTDKRAINCILSIFGIRDVRVKHHYKNGGGERIAQCLYLEGNCNREVRINGNYIIGYIESDIDNLYVLNSFRNHTM